MGIHLQPYRASEPCRMKISQSSFCCRDQQQPAATGGGLQTRGSSTTQSCVPTRYSQFESSLLVLNLSQPTFQGRLKALELLVHNSVKGFLQAAIFSVHPHLGTGYYTAACILECSSCMPGNILGKGFRPSPRAPVPQSRAGPLLQDLSDREEILQRNPCTLFTEPRVKMTPKR